MAYRPTARALPSPLDSVCRRRAGARHPPTAEDPECEVLMMTEDEKRWKEDGERNGWALPEPAAWPLRLPAIRHARVLWHAYATSYDQWVLWAIERGWC